MADFVPKNFTVTQFTSRQNKINFQCCPEICFVSIEYCMNIHNCREFLLYANFLIWKNFHAFVSLYLFNIYSQVAMFPTHHFSNANLDVLYGHLILHRPPSSVRRTNMNSLNVPQI